MGSFGRGLSPIIRQLVRLFKPLFYRLLHGLQDGTGSTDRRNEIHHKPDMVWKHCRDSFAMGLDISGVPQQVQPHLVAKFDKRKEWVRFPAACLKVDQHRLVAVRDKDVGATQIPVCKPQAMQLMHDL